MKSTNLKRTVCASNGARKRGEKDAKILIENLPGDTTADEIKKMFERMRGNIYLDLRSEHGRQAKDKDSAWTRTCYANIRCSEVSAALKAKELYNGMIMKREHGNHALKVTIKHMHDDVWFWMNSNGQMDIYAINMSIYEHLSIEITFDSSTYFVTFSSQFDSLPRVINDGQILCVIPPSHTSNYLKLCSFERCDGTQIDIENGINLKQIPSLLLYREVNILAEHDDSFRYLLPFALDNDLSDMISSMNIAAAKLTQTSPSKPISMLCSQGPRGTFSHSKGGYINSYDFACPIGTPVIAPRDGVIVDITDHHRAHGTELAYEKKCNYVTILHSDGSQCDLVHLRYKSIQFGIGKFVNAGDLIAYSGNTGFSGEPHIHMMVYLNRLIGENVHWQSIPIQFQSSANTNPCTSTPFIPISGQRYSQKMISYHLDPLLIPTDRLQIDVENAANWNEIDYIPRPAAEQRTQNNNLRIDEGINSLVYYTVGELSTLQCDFIIVPLSTSNVMNNWLTCRVLRRGGIKLMKQLMKRGFDLLHCANLKESKVHNIKIKDKDVSNRILIISGFDQLAAKKIMFVLMNDDDGKNDTFEMISMEEIFAYLCKNHDKISMLIHEEKYQKVAGSNKKKIKNDQIMSIGLELPIFDKNDKHKYKKLENQMCAIRNGLEKYVHFVANHSLNKVWTLRQFIICAQSLHDLHCFSDLMGTYFPRKPSLSRLDCKYIPHCPCSECYTNEYGLGQLHRKYKIELHANGIEEDLCSGVPHKFLYLNNALKPGQKTPNNNNKAIKNSKMRSRNDHVIIVNNDVQFEDIEMCKNKMQIDKISMAEQKEMEQQQSSNVDNDNDICSELESVLSSSYDAESSVSVSDEDPSEYSSDYASSSNMSSDCSYSYGRKNKKRKRSKEDILKKKVRPRKRRKIVEKNECKKNVFDGIEMDFDQKTKQNILKSLNGGGLCNNKNNDKNESDDHYIESCHLQSLIAQQSQLDMHTKQYLIYQQFEQYRAIFEKNNFAHLNATNNKAQMQKLCSLRTMQYKQQKAFQKSKGNDRLVIGQRHGVAGSEEHLKCIPLTPKIPKHKKKMAMQYLIQCVAPKRAYYASTIANIQLDDIGFAKIALEQMENQQLVKKNQQIREAEEMKQYEVDEKIKRRVRQQELARKEEELKKIKVKKELEHQLKRQKQRQREYEQKQKEKEKSVESAGVNPDNFEKIQNIIKVITKNKMAFCSTKIHSSQHAIHHVTNCKKCMSTLENFKGTVFK